MARDLAARVARQADAAETAGPGLEQAITAMTDQFALAMPRGMEATRLVRDAITALRTTRNLDRCDRLSVLGGLMTCAQLGLRPGVLGHAWLLPFWSARDRCYHAQLVIGYQGLVELAHRSGRIESLIARTVHANDHFDVDYGLADDLVHKPALTGPRGEPVAYYAVAKFTGGGHAFWVIPHDEMTAYRDRHATARDKSGAVVGPWTDHFEGMAHKTCVRQLAKWMPKAAELATAIEADGRIRVDITPTGDAAAVSRVVEGELAAITATTSDDDLLDADIEEDPS